MASDSRKTKADLLEELAELRQRAETLETLAVAHAKAIRALEQVQHEEHVFGEQLLLLTTTGAKTGRTRTTPLLYVPDGADIVLIASRGGNTSHPAWYHNLVANPHATALLNGRTIECIAHQADGDERARLWRMANDYYSGFDAYQSRTGGRTVPVMVLTPAPVFQP